MPNNAKRPNDDALEALGERIHKARHLEAQNPPPSAVGMAARLGTEFASGVLVGTAAGWLLDDWLGTQPWLLCICLIFGTAAGVKLMMQSLKQYDKQQQESESADS